MGSKGSPLGGGPGGGAPWPCLPNDINSREEEGDFLSGGFGGVGAVDGVGFDGFGEFGADGAGGRVGGVGGAHDVAVLLDGVFALQDLGDDGARDHEGDQVFEEGAGGVDRVEGFCLGLGEVEAAGGDDGEAGFLKLGVDFAGEVAAGGVGLDDGERAFGCHGEGPLRLGVAWGFLRVGGA